ncbi:MAG: hypothetical protein KDD35_04090 [Bdellovibrionales bacterium]|nr:hypothetical protein [Bdellovibrionales bacterium]
MTINKYHHLYSLDLPEAFIVTRAFGREAARLFEQNKVDFIPTFGVVRPKDFKNLSKNESFLSQPIQLHFLLFSEKGKQKFSQSQRLAIGEILRRLYYKNIKTQDQVVANQFFPIFGFGRLTDMDLSEISEQRADALARWAQQLKDMQITLEVWKDRIEEFKVGFQEAKAVEILPFKGFEWDRTFEDIPDIFYIATDAGAYENLSLLHYLFKVGAFGDYETGLKWLNQYLRTTDTADRKSMLQKLHRASLEEARYIPLFHQSYMAVFKKPLRLEISPYFAGTPFWKIKRN